MSTLCHAIHQLTNRLEVHAFPFDPELIPENGIYVLFESGETGHGAQRIVRVGTHTGKARLCARLSEHFLIENKDRSIFRKNIGCAMLNEDGDPFLADWNLDLTTPAVKQLHGARVDFAKQQLIERRVTAYLQTRFQFAVLRVDEPEQRALWEFRLIATVSRCEECQSSSEWLGRFSPNQKIRESGLWLVKGLYKKPFSESEFAEFEQAVRPA